MFNVKFIFLNILLFAANYSTALACASIPCITDPLNIDSEAKKLIATECKKINHPKNPKDPKEKPILEKNESFLNPERLECMEKYCEVEKTQDSKFRMTKCKKWNDFLARLKTLKEKKSEEELSRAQIDSETPAEDAKTIKDPKSTASKAEAHDDSAGNKRPKKSSQKID